MELAPSTPNWLDDNFLQKCISGDGLDNSKFQINSVQLKYAVPKGDNYGSVMIRLILNNNDVDERRYILKVGHTEGELKQAMEVFDSYVKEIDMYSNVAPALHKLLEDAGISSRFACTYFHFDQKHDVIVLEDLIPLGYKLAHRTKGLDLQHCKLLYSKYAILHGSSMRYVEMHSVDSFKSYYIKPIISSLTKDDDLFFSRKIITKRLEDFAEDLLLWEGYEKESNYLLSISHKFYDMVLEESRIVKDGVFNALLHGDCWINNIMFKDDDNGYGLDARLVDLQLCNYNSIVQDFAYTLTACVSSQVIKHHFNDIIQHYIENLRSTLLKLNYKGTIPTLGQFKEEIKRKSVLIMFYVSQICPFVLKEVTEENKVRQKDEIVNIEVLNKIVADGRKSPDYQSRIHAVVDLLREEQMFFQ